MALLNSIFVKILATAVVAVFAQALVTERGTNAAEFVPLTPVGNVGAVQINSGDARLYYQNSNGSISQYCVSGTYTTGSSTCIFNLVPSSEVLLGTPIAVTEFGSQSYTQVHVFFLSPNRVVSEYIWTTGVNGGGPGGFQGGPTCTTCLTNSGFIAASGTSVLYAMENAADNTLRVGFVSAGSPGTLSEAVKTSSGGWVLASLPN